MRCARAVRKVGWFSPPVATGPGVLYFFFRCGFFFERLYCFLAKKKSALKKIALKKVFRAKKNTQTLFFLRGVFFFSVNAANFRSGQKSVMDNSLGNCGGTWCVRGLRDGAGDEASLNLTPPPAWSYTLFHPFLPFCAFLPHPLFFWVDCSPPTGGADL